MTGAYKRHFKLVPRDWHDWDVASPPALIHTLGGKTLLSAAPKDGHLYGIDLADNSLLYRTPVTKIENVDAPFASDKAVHFCPGASGGSEWNGPAYDPDTNLIITGEVDWCTTVKRQTDEQLQDAPYGGPGSATRCATRFTCSAGRMDRELLGRLGLRRRRRHGRREVEAAVELSDRERRDADRRRVGVRGRCGREFLRSRRRDRREAVGSEDWRRDRRRGYRLPRRRGREIAVATGLTGVAWPTEVVTGKIVVLGLDNGAAEAIKDRRARRLSKRAHPCLRSAPRRGSRGRSEFRPRHLQKRFRPAIGAHPVEVIAIGRVEPVHLGRHDQRQTGARRDRFRVPDLRFRIGNVGQDDAFPLGELLQKLDRQRRAVLDHRLIDPPVIADRVLREDRLSPCGIL